MSTIICIGFKVSFWGLVWDIILNITKVKFSLYATKIYYNYYVALYLLIQSLYNTNTKHNKVLNPVLFLWIEVKLGYGIVRIIYIPFIT